MSRTSSEDVMQVEEDLQRPDLSDWWIIRISLIGSVVIVVLIAWGVL
jgi:hypothetical protein